MKKVVLAFSGGLDTSFCCVYLSRDLGLEVHSVIVNTGGFSEEELKEVEQRAYELGVKSHAVVDETNNYYQSSIKYLIFGNVLKNATYPLSVSAERVSQATAIAHYVQKIGADYVAHGSTGAGNDQVRFDMIFQTLIPNVEIITPIRDLKLSREAEIDYLAQHGFPYSAAKAQYSINKGIWGTSVGGKETLTSDQMLPETAWPTPVTSTEPQQISITFEKGEPVALNGKTLSSVEVIQQLQAIAQPYGIGRDVHVGDTIIGIKGRVGFEAAAPVILIKAHHTLEKHTLTKWQLSWKDQLSGFYGNWMHEGQMHDPVMRDIEAFLQNAQETVSGVVQVMLYPYRFQVLGIQSDHDLMSNAFGTYGEMNNTWSGDDVKGFSKIFGNQTIIWHKVNKK
jgi:argininosuccinate synthase